MNKELVSHLQTVAVMLAIIPIEKFEQHVQECRKSLSDADSIGPIIDPTGWMRANADGSMEDARHQLTIAEHLLKARQAIDVREDFVKEKVGVPGSE